MAKRTTARGKGRPTAYGEIPSTLAFITRQELLDELVLSNRAGGQEMAAVREKIDALDSRVTGEIKVLRERLKAGEKRAEPIGGIDDRLKLVAAELTKLHHTNSELEKKLHGTTVAAMERIEQLEERLRVVEERSNDATHGMFALSNRIRKVESDRDVAIAEAVLKIGELDSKLVQAMERIEELENAKPSPERTFKPTSKPNAEGPCVILAGSPWQGFRVYGAFINHEEAYLYQNKHLFREDFWWVLPLERTH